MRTCKNSVILLTLNGIVLKRDEAVILQSREQWTPKIRLNTFCSLILISNVHNIDWAQSLRVQYSGSSCFIVLRAWGLHSMGCPCFIVLRSWGHTIVVPIASLCSELRGYTVEVPLSSLCSELWGYTVGVPLSSLYSELKGTLYCFLLLHCAQSLRVHYSSSSYFIVLRAWGGGVTL